MDHRRAITASIRRLSSVNGHRIGFFGDQSDEDILQAHAHVAQLEQVPAAGHHLAGDLGPYVLAGAGFDLILAVGHLVHPGDAGHVLQRPGQPFAVAGHRSLAIFWDLDRVGKGGGYSDLEFALLTEERRIDRHTPIVTSVHPLQIVNEQIPMTEHDIPLNAIATPDEFIEIKSPLPRPKGIYWEMLPPEKIADIPVLKNRKQRLVK